MYWARLSSANALDPPGELGLAARLRSNLDGYRSTDREGIAPGAHRIADT